MVEDRELNEEELREALAALGPMQIDSASEMVEDAIESTIRNYRPPENRNSLLHVSRAIEKRRRRAAKRKALAS